MVFINMRKAFIAVMFVLGAAALLLVYSGSAGLFSSGGQAASAPPPDPPADVAPSVGKVGPGPPEDNMAAAGRENENFFVEYRLQREKSRGRQVELLEDIVNNPSSASETRKAAQDQLMEISGSISKEVRVENLLRAKGYRDAVACMDSRGVTVVMECSGLSPAEESVILEIVSRETGFGEQGIVIIPKKQ